jgi:hypothetical protein
MAQAHSEGLNYDPAGKLEKTSMQLKYNHRDQPHIHTAGKLTAHRADKMKPSITFDVDGDGVVSAEDFLLASKFDTNGDKVLNDSEAKALRRQMVLAVLDDYKQVPSAPTKETNALIDEFRGENLDELIASERFLQRFQVLGPL